MSILAGDDNSPLVHKRKGAKKIEVSEDDDSSDDDYGNLNMSQIGNYLFHEGLEEGEEQKENDQSVAAAPAKKKQAKKKKQTKKKESAKKRCEFIQDDVEHSDEDSQEVRKTRASARVIATFTLSYPCPHQNGLLQADQYGFHKRLTYSPPTLPFFRSDMRICSSSLSAVRAGATSTTGRRTTRPACIWRSTSST